MTQKLGIVLFFATQIYSSSYGQKLGIVLIDSIYKFPIENVYMTSYPTKSKKASDHDGYIDLSNLTNSETTLTFRRIGYQEKTIHINELKNVSKNYILLKPHSYNISQIKIHSNSKSGLFNSISDLDIALRPTNNSQDILRLVPGLFIGQHAGGGKAEQIFMRGFDIDHGTDLMITVDDMPVNMVSHAHGQGYSDLHFTIPEFIEKVDFEKGPYYADKGNFCTAGYVGLSTKKFLKNNFAKLEAGQYHTYRTVAGINLLKTKTDYQKHNLYAGTEGMFSQGFFDHPQNLVRWNGLLKYYGNISDNHTLSSSLSGFYSQWNASGQIPNRAVEMGIISPFGAIDPTEGGTTSRNNINLELKSKIGETVLKNQVYFSNYAFELYSNFTFFKIDSVNGDQIRQKEKRNLLGYNGSIDHQYNIGKLNATTKWGIQSRIDWIRDIELTRTKDKSINIERLNYGHIDEFNLAAFVAQKLSITPKLDIMTSARLDFFSNTYDDLIQNNSSNAQYAFVSPKLNIDYNLNDRVKLYLYNGMGYHSNDTRVAVISNGRSVAPPAFGTDLGGIFKLNDKWYLQSALWQLWLDQEMVYVGDEAVIEAGGQTQRMGWDISTRYQVSKNLFGDIDLSIAHSRALNAPQDNNYIPLAPRLTCTGGLVYKNTRGWNASLRYRYMGDRPANESNATIAKGYLILDALVQYTHKKWEIGIDIHNLLNSSWKETQFETESRLKDEATPITEIHFTPGVPFFVKTHITFSF